MFDPDPHHDVNAVSSFQITNSWFGYQNGMLGQSQANNESNRGGNTKIKTRFLTFGVPGVSPYDPSRKEEPSASLYCT